MTRTLAQYCDGAAEYPAVFRMTWTAERIVAEIQAAEVAAGEPVTDSETISGALLDALKRGDDAWKQQTTAPTTDRRIRS